MLRRQFVSLCGCVVPVPAAWAKVCADSPCVDADALRRARRTFDELARAAAGLDLPARITFVDAAVSRLVALGDDAELGAVDVWLTPYETLARGRGDCEDHAIAKYLLLRESGTAAADTRLLFARIDDPHVAGRRAPHVVAVARRPFLDPLVLDNLVATPRPVSQRADLEAVFSFDRAQIWAGACGPCTGRPAWQLRPWREVLARTARQAAVH